jgi:hypothetical protein
MPTIEEREIGEPAEMSSERSDGWPRSERVIDDDELVDTRVSPPPRHAPASETYVVDEPVPAGPPPADRFGRGVLAGVVLALVVAALVAAWLIARRQDHHHGNARPAASTVVVTTTSRPQPSPAPVVTPRRHPATTAEAATATTAAATPAAPATTTSATTTTTPAQPTTPSTASVPDLARGGGDVKSAVQDLAESGLRASVQYVPGTDPLGTVTAQFPKAGETATSGAHVTLSVSSGPGRKPQESVPDVGGRAVPGALRALNGAGLRLILLKQTVADRAEAGRIVEQTPAAGASAPRNAQVLVYMGAYRSG